MRGQSLRVHSGRRQVFATLLGAMLVAAAGMVSSAAAATDPVNITMYSNGGPNAQRYQAAIDEFNAIQSDIVVTLNVPGGTDDDYKANFPQIAASSDKPDLAWYWVGGGGRYPSMVEAGLLEPLDDLYASEGWDAVYPESTLSIYTSPDGSRYAVPDTFVWHTPIYYNKEAFAAAGVTPPPEDRPWFESLDELYDAIDKLREAGYDGISIGGKEGWTLSIFKDDFTQRLVPEEVHRDYVVASEPGQTPTYEFSDPRFVESQQVFTDFGTTHNAFAEGFLGRSFAEAHQYFANGNAAMLADGSWAAGTALIPTEAPDMDFGWMLLPPLSPDMEPKFLTYAGNAVMVMRGPNSEAAKTFVRWLMSKEQADKVAASGVLVPARTDVDPDQMRAGNSEALVSQWEKLGTIGTMDPWGDYAPAALVQRDYQLAQELLLGSATPEDAAAQLDQIADDLRAGP